MIWGKDIMPFMQGPDRVRIIEDGKELFIGYWGLTQIGTNLYNKIQDAQIKSIRASIDIKHKDWEKLGLMEPLMPGEHPEYSFSDLTTSLYYNITIERATNDET